jgi:hypothetical protein
MFELVFGGEKKEVLFMNASTVRVALGAALVLPAMAGVTQAADLAVMAAAVNGTPIGGGPVNTVEVAPGDELTIEFYLSGWTPDLLRAYQLQIDDSGYTSGTAGSLVPNIGLAAVDTGHGSYVFSGSDPGNPPPPDPPEVLALVDTSQAAYRWASTLTDPTDSISDPGGSQYVGTLVVDVSGDAEGTFTLGLNPAANASFLRDDSDPPAAITVSFQPVTIDVTAVAVCTDAASCCDLDSNNITDDVCNWCECNAPACNIVAKTVPADISGAFGACPLDTFCNIHDRNQALAGFAGTTTCELINIDAGGSFGTCPPDGFANIHDANHALACFAGTNTCACGPTPQGPGAPTVVGDAQIRMVANKRHAAPGDIVQIRAFVDATAPLQGYQLHVQSNGGQRGGLKLHSIEIEGRDDALLPTDDRFDAVNVTKGQVLAGMDNTASAHRAKEAYLATFNFRLSDDAAGAFVIEALFDESAGDQTFLVGSGESKVQVLSASTAVVQTSTKSNGRTR